MTPERWREIEAVFEEAIELSGDARARVLAEHDADTRREVESLLANVDGASDSLRDAISIAVDSLAHGEAIAQIGARIGAYRITGLLGRGGMGTVYLARRDDDELDYAVAIKVLHELASPQLIERFRDERQILATLDHPSIVRFIDAGSTDGGLPYFVMEHVDGVPFAAYARSVPVRRRIELALRLAEAVQHAHERLVVHRDIKPSNILVDATGNPKLLDFGIAKLLDGTHRELRTRAGIALFTPEYASPEQVRGEVVTVTSDVYSLGAVLYEALAGRPPQRAGASPLETLRAICEDDPPRPSAIAGADVRRELIGDLDNIALRALRKDARERYATVAELAADLDRHLAGRPVRAREPTLGYRAAKFVGRHRGAVALGAIAITALASAVIVSIVEARRADLHAARVDRQRRDLLVERGWQELAGGQPGRALPYLAEAFREGEDSAAVRLLIAEALRPFHRERAAIHFDPGIVGVALAGDGSRLALCGFAGTCRIHDAAGAQRVEVRVQAQLLTTPVFTPDAARLVAAEPGGAIHVWDAATGAHRSSLDTRGTVATLTAPANDRIVAATIEGSLIVWDLSTGAHVVSELRTVVHHATSRDGGRLVTGAGDGVVRIHEARTGATLAELRGHDGPVSPRLSRDGARAYSFGRDGGVRIWALDTGAPVAALAAHGRPIAAVDASPDDRLLATSGQDGAVKLWDARSGTLARELATGLRNVRAVRFSPDGAWLAGASGDNTFRVWDVASGALAMSFEAFGGGSARGATVGPFDVVFAPDGDLWLVSGTSIRRVHLDRAPLVAELHARGEPHAATLSPDEATLAVVGRDLAEIWDVARRERTARLDVAGANSFDVAWSPDGTRIVVASNDRFARVFRADGALVATLSGHTDKVNRAAFRGDGARILTASSDGTVRIWEPGGAPVATLAHPGPVMSAVWSRGGSRIASAGWDRVLRVWDAETATVLATLEDGATEFLDVTFSPDDRRLISAGHEGEVALWDLASSSRTVSLDGHAGAVTTAVWSPDGGLVATSSDDQTIGLWDPATGRLLASRKHGAGVYQVTWSRDGRRLLGASLDDSLRIWDVQRFGGTPAELDAFLAAHVPYRLVESRLERVR